jgi:hypothetical protein
LCTVRGEHFLYFMLVRLAGGRGQERKEGREGRREGGREGGRGGGRGGEKDED